MQNFTTYIGTCWGALIGVFAALNEWDALQHALTYSKKSSLSLFTWKHKIDVGEWYSYTLHEKLVESDIQVRVPLLNLNTKGLVYFIMNRLSYQNALNVLQASIQTIWDKPISINNDMYIEPTIFDSNCFYHVLSHDKSRLPSEVNILFPFLKDSKIDENWQYDSTKSVIVRIIEIVRGRNIHRCTFEIPTLGEANSVKINYHYLD